MNLTDEKIRTALSDIESTPDLLEKAMKLAGLVSCLFREAGWPLVVVGGSAVEFYTEGAYMSGDIDFCRQTLAPIPLRLAQEIMGKLDAVGGPRSWKAAGLFVDLLGLLENESKKSCTVLQTPYGPVTLIPPEMILVERVLAAVYPTRNQEQYDIAKKMMLAGLLNNAAFDWSEAERLAALPAFHVLNELQELRKEVYRELENAR